MSATVDTGTLARDIQGGLGELQAFVETPEFRALLDELWALPVEQRARFVAEVILNPGELAARGIRVPPDVKVMRSAFRDNRPTLFCVARYIPEGNGWSKVTITYDNPSGEPALPYPAVADRFEQEVTTDSHL